MDYNLTDKNKKIYLNVKLLSWLVRQYNNNFPESKTLRVFVMIKWSNSRYAADT